MAAAVSPFPPTSPPVLPNSHNDSPSLPPLITTHLPRRASSTKAHTYASKRMSTFSQQSRLSNPSQSRPASHVFPIFHSSLPYTLVRDFAYPITHPAHYGPVLYASGISTPASESRRLSDPAISSWEERNWSATPPWMSETASNVNPREHLPAMAFTDGGPPYSEDEDLHSPVVTTSRHKKHKSSFGVERGRLPGAAGGRGLFVGSNGDGSETYYVRSADYDPNADGPGGEFVTYPPDEARHAHRSSNYDSGGSRNRYYRDPRESEADGESDVDHSDAGDEHGRYSRNYSFTIASPDEEMHGKAVALFDFESEHQNELPLTEGQIILVSYRHGQGWLVAEDPKTGESGLVPEEFVRLVRDIEGGLNGLGAVADLDSGSELVTPVGVESATTPTKADFARQPAVSGNGNHGHSGHVHALVEKEKHPPVQSSFSTSSKDLDPYPLPGRTEDGGSAPAVRALPENVKPPLR